MSTALMYAFAQREDTQAVDEPLYGHYLATSKAPHPGADDVMAQMDCDGERVVEQIVLGPSVRPVLFIKHMAHHLRGLDWQFLEHTVNVILTRDPAQVIASLIKQLPDAALRDTGFDIQVELLQHLQSRGQSALVLDSGELLKNPAQILGKLCGALDLDYEPAMLSWSAGPKPCDGVWAPHWYHSVHRSTGFMPYRQKQTAAPESNPALLAECEPLYARLRALALEI